jgi:hypothetical protein
MRIDNGQTTNIRELVAAATLGPTMGWRSGYRSRLPPRSPIGETADCQEVRGDVT